MHLWLNPICTKRAQASKAQDLAPVNRCCSQSHLGCNLGAQATQGLVTLILHRLTGSCCAAFTSLTYERQDY